MKNFELELRSLHELYDAVEVQLQRQYHELRSGLFGKPGLEEPGNGFTRQLEAANHQLAELAGKWKTDRVQLPSDEKRLVENRATHLQQRARYLLGLVRRNIALLRRLQDTAQESLQQIRVGARFLHCARISRENHPKFIDTRH